MIGREVEINTEDIKIHRLQKLVRKLLGICMWLIYYFVT